MYMGLSSSFSTSSTYLRCSVEFAKLLVLRSYGVCWIDEIGRGGDVDLVIAGLHKLLSTATGETHRNSAIHLRTFSLLDRSHW